LVVFVKSTIIGCLVCDFWRTQTSEEYLNLAKKTNILGQENMIYPGHRLGGLSMAKKIIG